MLRSVSRALVWGFGVAGFSEAGGPRSQYDWSMENGDLAVNNKNTAMASRKSLAHSVLAAECVSRAVREALAGARAVGARRRAEW